MSAPATQPSMKWSTRVATVAGIGIYIHWTFLLLALWIIYSEFRQGGNLVTSLTTLGFVLSVFACVVLHELGHALTARRYGIGTRDITLLPIGGVASLERIPEEPRQELAIAVAGPAVNVAIAAVLYVLIRVVGGVGLEDLLSGRVRLTSYGLGHGVFLANLLVVNLALVVFNLLPAFPMDGGRVLRAALATRLDYARATQIAATVGQGLAILFGFYGFTTGNPFLIFIAFFVYLGAEAEAQAVALRTTFRNVPVREAMMTRFRTLSDTDSLETAVNELLAGAQQDFPVVSDGRLVGLLPRKLLIQSLANGRRVGTVGEAMEREFPVVDHLAPLDQVFERMREQGVVSVPVVQDGQIVGVLTLENIGEWAMIQAARQHLRPRGGLRQMIWD